MIKVAYSRPSFKISKYYCCRFSIFLNEISFDNRLE